MFGADHKSALLHLHFQVTVMYRLIKTELNVSKLFRFSLFWMDPLSRLSDEKFKSMAFVLKYCRTSMDESFTVGNLYSLLSSYKTRYLYSHIFMIVEAGLLY